MLCGVTARTALPVALVVGTLLSAVNQGAVIAGGGGTPAVWLRVSFNYAVPFVVSSMGFLGAGRLRPGNASPVDEAPSSSVRATPTPAEIGEHRATPSTSTGRDGISVSGA